MEEGTKGKKGLQKREDYRKEGKMGVKGTTGKMRLEGRAVPGEFGSPGQQ